MHDLKLTAEKQRFKDRNPYSPCNKAIQSLLKFSLPLPPLCRSDGHNSGRFLEDGVAAAFPNRRHDDEPGGGAQEVRAVLAQLWDYRLWPLLRDSSRAEDTGRLHHQETYTHCTCVRLLHTYSLTVGRQVGHQVGRIDLKHRIRNYGLAACVEIHFASNLSSCCMSTSGLQVCRT